MQNEHESTDIIRIDHLNKTFGDVKAVNDLSFRVKKGELFAFLGVNGAGITRTVSLINFLLQTLFIRHRSFSPNRITSHAI